MTEEERAQRIAYTEERRLGEDCERFLQSEGVKLFLDTAEQQTLAAALGTLADLGSPAGEAARFRALIVISVLRSVREFFAKTAETGVYSGKLLDALMKNDKPEPADAS